MVGYPPPKDFKNMVRSKMIKNCPITPANIAAANKIFGPDAASLKGKTTRTTPKPVLIDHVKIPNQSIDINKEVTLAADVMFVDGLPFLSSTSHNMKFTTTEYVPRRTNPILIKSLNKILSLYSNRGFKVTTALVDRGFESLQDDLTGLLLNTTAASEHVPNIEHQIRVMKERARAIRSNLPFQHLPSRMIIELINFVTLWLNAFPPSSGISDTFIPKTIVTGTALEYEKHCKLPFGAYVETHEERSQTNTLYERAQGAICLDPTSNFQGSYKCLCLNTGRKITRKQFREVPMPEHVIKGVYAIAERDKQLGDMVFTDRDGNPIGDNDDDDAIDGTNDTDITGVDINNSSTAMEDDGNHADMEEEQAESEASEQHGTTDNGPGTLLEPSANDGSLSLPVDPNKTAEMSASFEEEHETAGVDDKIDLLAGIDTIEEDSETTLNGIAPDEPP
jgi:hypothetical protein